MSSQKFTKNFKNLTNRDVKIAGGKGASLGEMTKAKNKVPPGFVVLAAAFDQFLEESNIYKKIEKELERINYEKMDSVNKSSIVIRKLIDNSKMSKDLEKEIVLEFKKLNANFVAVRSSATAEDSLTASWAGELETYLHTNEDKLLLNVKRCWSSLFTPRAIFYRKEKKLLKRHVSVAVVIQKMVESEISGIAFTVHPVTQDDNQMIIEAGWGLGEAIVSGAINPDRYIIDKKEWLIVNIDISKQDKLITRQKRGGINWLEVSADNQEQQKLKGEEIIELAKICNQIEKHYKKPQDIEWAFTRGHFFITQSRPITTLK